jgi:hypothetical protein
MVGQRLIADAVLPRPPLSVLDPAGDVEAWRCWSFDVLLALALAGAQRTSGPVRVTVGLPQSGTPQKNKLIVNAIMALLVGERIVESKESVVDVCVRLVADQGLRLDLTRCELREQSEE